MTDAVATVATPVDLVWPEISEVTYMQMWAVPVVLSVLIWIWFNVLWTENLTMFKEPQQIDQETGRAAACASSMISRFCPGKVQGSGMAQGNPDDRQYPDDWKTTFDAVFLGIMISLLFVLLGVTALYEPLLFKETAFWLNNLMKIAIMCSVSLVGGLICRALLEIDENGYIKGDTKESKARRGKNRFRVNYTRKFQHFSAYAIPLLVKAPGIPGNPVLHLIWGDFFTLIGFLLLIKPIREAIKPCMLMFNSLDRPEDRPNCLKWIVGGNILPGLCMIIFFDWLFLRFGADQQKLVMIFVLIAGVGDGLAEPVGIRFGRHQYRTTSCGAGDHVYVRSFEGSTCVFITTFIWIIMFYQYFENAEQFWLLMAFLPIASTFAEATSPHTMDTPFLMGLGGLSIYVVLRWF